MPVQGNAGVPEVTAAHGSVTFKPLTFDGLTQDVVLSMPMSGLGRARVTLRGYGGNGIAYPGSILVTVVGTGNQPATLADLNAAPFSYYLDDRVALTANQISLWNNGDYDNGVVGIGFCREYAVFTPFITVVVSAGADYLGTIDAVIMGVTG